MEQIQVYPILAHVGNNGYSRNPHIHIGAYRNGSPVAISFDPQKVGEAARRVDECYWIFGISDEEYKEKYGKPE